MRRIRVLATFLLLAPPPLWSAPPAAEYLGEYRLTYYYVAVEDARYRGLRRGERLRDERGRVLARVSRAFRRELDREGSGRLRDGRVLNVATRRRDGWRYTVLAAGSWGLSARGLALEPLVTLAADPASLPPGTRLYLPALAGSPRPDGSTHDGCSVVSDVGSAIRGARIDVFIGERRLLADLEARVESHRPTAVFRIPGEDCAEGRP